MPSIFASIHPWTYPPLQLSPSSHPPAWAGCQGLLVQHGILYDQHIPQIDLLKRNYLKKKTSKAKLRSICYTAQLCVFNNDQQFFVEFTSKFNSSDNFVNIYHYKEAIPSKIIPSVCPPIPSTCCSLSTLWNYCVESLNRLVLMSPSEHSRGPFIADTHTETQLPWVKHPCRGISQMCICVGIWSISSQPCGLEKTPTGVGDQSKHKSFHTLIPFHSITCMVYSFLTLHSC